MLAWFEKLIHPYPDAITKPPPRSFLPFIWACTKGLRRYIIGMTIATAIIGAFEALLFAMMGARTWQPVAAGTGSGWQPLAHRTANPAQTSDDGRCFSDVVALEISLSDAQSKYEFLSG